MSRCFADTAYFIALLSPSDEAHAAAVRESARRDRQTVTTSAVLNEFGNYFAKPPNRGVVRNFILALRQNRLFTLVQIDERLFDLALDLYGDRPDKLWSLTDCILFVVMREMGLADVLTTDHHFEQAGFTLLLPRGS